MKIYVNNQEISSHMITYTELNFGETKGRKTLSYEIIISHKEFIENFELIYKQCIIELREDDYASDKFETLQIEHIDYPSLEEFLKMSDDEFSSFIYAYLKFDIFSYYFPENNRNTASFTLITLEEIDNLNLEIKLRGQLFQYKK